VNKIDADKLIVEYQQKIFGFAMSKVRNITDAEELASKIVFELYKSFLKVDKIANVDGYVYRIASNVYSRYIDKKIKNQYVDIYKIDYAVTERGFDSIEEEETYKKLRQQIGLMSKRQRAITYMKYYKEMSVNGIASELDISVGTVKWHLSDIRSGLKERIDMVKNDNLSVNPIYFAEMGHCGMPGATGDTRDMFDSRLKQNIAWCCYYKAKTLTDVAKELEIPVAYVEGELKKLVEWGYINQIDNSKNPKYLTNMYITDEREDFSDNIIIKKEAAKYLCDNLFKYLFEKFDKADDNWGMNCPDNDKNYLKYNLVMMALSCLGDEGENWDEFAVKRPDGGYFISYATVADDCTKIPEYKYVGCGWMWNQVCRGDKLVLQSKQYNCMYSDRELSWRSNKPEDWEDLYSYISSGCDKEKISIESYSNLLEKGYVADGENQVALINVEDGNLESAITDLVSSHIDIPELVIEERKRVDERLYKINKAKYPVHIEKLVRFYNSNSFTWGEFVPFIIETMLDEGMLQPLTAKQKKAVFTVVAIAK